MGDKAELVLEENKERTCISQVLNTVCGKIIMRFVLLCICEYHREYHLCGKHLLLAL